MNNEKFDKIIILNSSPSRSGIGRYSDDLISLFPSQTKAYSFILDSRLVNEEYPGTKVKGFYPPLMTNGWYLNLNFQTFIFRKIRNEASRLLEDGGIVHISDPFIEPIKKKGKQIVTIFDLFALDSRNTPVKSERRHLIKTLKEYRKIDYILVTTDRVKKELAENNFNSEITTIYPGTSKWFFKIDKPKSDIRKELELPLDKTLVLSVSSNRYRKNVRIIPSIMDRLGESYQLVRIGTQISNSLTFRGISNETLNKIYNSCDVLLQPSLDEGFGYPIPEAMATGLPIVCSDIEVFREIAKDSAYFSKIDPESFADSIKEVIQSSEKYSKMAYNAAKRFSIERFREEVDNFYTYVYNS
ncbi:MAG: glycosyltransferase family 4 protein [Candidatus Thermoplasmatota archaeon]|nr:glycosyltransferase family 4 protein [Candidatus Thermoplasmatota archaeon]